ncbi:MAG: DNA repair protein RecO [bacterium]
MQAIVLRRNNFRENDQIITFYTREAGKLELLARGIKKIASKNSPHLSLGSLVNMEMANGKEIDHLTKAVSIDSRAKLRSELDKATTVSKALDFTDRILESKQIDEGVFDLLDGWLVYVLEKNILANQMLYGYMLCLLSQLGFNPELEQCVNCGATKECKGFSNQLGGIVCNACSQNNNEIIELDDGRLQTIQILNSADWEKINDLPNDENLFMLITEFAQYCGNKKIRFSPLKSVNIS